MKTQKFLKAYVLNKIRSPVSLNSCHKPRTMRFVVSLQFSHDQNCLRFGILCTSRIERVDVFGVICVCSNLRRRRTPYISQTYKLLTVEMCAEMLCHTIYTRAVLFQIACEKHTAWRVYRLACVNDQWRANKHVNKTRRIFIVMFSTGSCLMYKPNLRLRE